MKRPYNRLTALRSHTDGNAIQPFQRAAAHVGDGHGILH